MVLYYAFVQYNFIYYFSSIWIESLWLAVLYILKQLIKPNKYVIVLNK